MPYVAIVDDEEPVRKALRRLMRAAGLQAEGFAGGREFLEAAAQRPPDCVVLDLHMGGMSGLQVLRKLQAAQYVAKNPGQVCPAKWQQGAETLTPSLDLVGKI